MRSTVPLVVACVALVAVAGCSANSSGAAGAGTSRSPAPTSGQAPSITEDELDIGVFSTSPCRLMRPDQLAQHGLVAPGTVIEGTAGHGCRWDADTPEGTPVEVEADLSSGGLAGAYQRRGTFAFFEPSEVASYPAVHTATDTTAPQHGHCTVRVGVSRSALLNLTVTVRNPTAVDYGDACWAADKIATIVIGTLKRIA